MSSQVATEFAEHEPWGTASKRRGLAYTELAIEFVRQHPIGTVLNNDKFDEWLEAKELLTLPPLDAPKSSDAWLGHLQRRHIMRGRINNAATHPRMADMGSQAFVITATAGGFEVVAPNVAISKGDLTRKISTLTQTKRKQLAHLMQSADWSQLPVHEKDIAETIYDDINAFTEDTMTGVSRIRTKLAKLESRIRAAIEIGAIVPKNGALQHLISYQEEEPLTETPNA